MPWPSPRIGKRSVCNGTMRWSKWFLASGKLCASLCPHPYKSHHFPFRLFSLHHIRESVFAIPKFKSFRFIQDKWNTQFVSRYWRAFTRSYVTKMNITFRRVETMSCYCQRWLSVRPQPVWRRCNFLLASYRRMNVNCQAKQDKWLQHWHDTNITRTKDATQRQRVREHIWPKFRSCCVTNLLACILYKSVLVGLGLVECLAKCSLLFIFVAVLCANNSTNRHTPFVIGPSIHRERNGVSGGGKRRSPRATGTATACSLSETNFEKIIIVRLKRRRLAKKKMDVGKSGRAHSSRRPQCGKICFIVYWIWKTETPFNISHSIETFCEAKFICVQRIYVKHFRWVKDVYMCSH